MTHASVFSGIGGPEVAATMLGWDNLFHCEINPFGRKVLEYWFPKSKSYEDITKTDFTEWRGRVNVLTGGFPCQPFSYAGQRRGAEDDRYLWPHMHRCINEVQPDWVVCENVAGILTMVEQGEVSPMESQASMFDEGDILRRYRLTETFTLERISRDIEADGYEVQSVLVPACAVGAPHRRDRVFIVGHRLSADGEGEQGERAESRQSVYGGSKQVESGGRGGEDGNQRNTTDTDREGLEERMLKGGRTMETQGAAGMDNRTERSCSEQSSPHPDSHRGCEVDKHMEPEQPDGSEPFGNCREWDATDTSNTRFQETRSEQPSARTGRHALWDGEWVERLRGLKVAGCGRWANFPTVSPVHRGNDGIPFPLDNLAIPSAKWRTESLKAYGNAIVPQVMYEIFRAIEIIENGNCNNNQNQ